MNADQFADKLKTLNACSAATAWAAGKTLSQAWQECQRPDWMLWLLGKSKVSKKVIATIAVEFAEMTVGNASAHPAVAECIAVVKRYLAGEATEQELSAARSAARSTARSTAEYAAEYAASAARYAARSAAWSAAEPAAEPAASAARYAARSAAWSAAEPAARSAAWSAQCDIICKHVDAERITTLIK